MLVLSAVLVVALGSAWAYIANQSSQSAAEDQLVAVQDVVDTFDTGMPEDMYEDTRKDVYLAELPAVGSCETTKVAMVGTRLEGAPESGSYIKFENGNEQVSYDALAGVTNSQVGDEVKACVESLPSDCPSGDSRGIVYKTTNTRTGESWSAPNASHLCGGA